MFVYRIPEKHATTPRDPANASRIGTPPMRGIGIACFLRVLIWVIEPVPAPRELARHGRKDERKPEGANSQKNCGKAKAAP